MHCGHRPIGYLVDNIIAVGIILLESLTLINAIAAGSLSETNYLLLYSICKFYNMLTKSVL